MTDFTNRYKQFRAIKSSALRTGLLVLAFVFLSGCETAKRFAPPGFVKYEDIAQGIPVDPEIQKLIDSEVIDKKASYPNLSEVPREIPEGEDKDIRDMTIENLLAEREIVNTDIANARSLAQAEFANDGAANNIDGGVSDRLENDSLNAQQSLDQIAIDNARKEILEEAKKPLPEPLETPSAPKQNDNFEK